MSHGLISILLISVLLHGSVAVQDQLQSPRQSQSVADMQDVLRKAREKDKTVSITLDRKVQNQKRFKGKVREISDSQFVITDEKTRTTTSLDYADVREVHQAGMSKGAKIALYVVGGVVLFFVVGAVVVLARGND